MDADAVLCYDGQGWSTLVGLVNFWDVVELIDEINYDLRGKEYCNLQDVAG